ncbi:MAG: DUF488 domain-containing protein [Bacteroidetes bacterium]|nr:MAG: DUF488 domain-containing protein [Bacteroidota bacterium]
MNDSAFSSVNSVPIYTIGYGSRTLEEFVSLLKKYEIDCVVDIRSKPYSSFKVEFSKQALERGLPRYGIRYCFMGDVLGGKPDDLECYTNGMIDYEKCRAKESYRQGIVQVKKLWNGIHRITLMCAEAKPQECHRTKMVGEWLAEENISVMHIDETGVLKSQQEVIEIIQGVTSQLELFRNSY